MTFSAQKLVAPETSWTSLLASVCLLIVIEIINAAKALGELFTIASPAAGVAWHTFL